MAAFYKTILLFIYFLLILQKIDSHKYDHELVSLLFAFIGKISLFIKHYRMNQESLMMMMVMLKLKKNYLI